MMKWIKIMTSVLGIVVLFAIIAAVLLVTFVSPNRFKPIITDQVMKVTNRQLTIDGDLSWSFFPYLGVKVGHAVLSNPAEFTQQTFIEVDQATLGVKLLPLLHAQIESSGILLKGMKLNLIKNANGRTNWQDLQSTSTIHKAKSHSKSNGDEIDEQSSFGLAVSTLDISNATITWLDEQSKQSVNLNEFDLHAKNINLNKAFPFSASFNVVSENPAISGKVSLQSQIILDVDSQIYLLKDTTLNAKINNVDISLKSNIVVNFVKETIQLEELNGQVANLSLTGKVSVTNLAAEPQIAGQIQVNPVDFKAFLDAIGQNRPDLQVMKNLSGDMDFTIKNLKTVSTQGRFKIDAVETTKLKLSDINVEVHFKDNILQLTPVTAKLYQGDLYSQVKVDLTNALPLFTVQATLSNVQAEPLLQDLGAGNQKFKLSGLANVDTSITTSGVDVKTIERNLNGSGNLKFNDGVLIGIDVGYYIDSARAFVKQETASSNNTEKTPFGSLTGSVVIHDGVITNNDLHFDAPRFDTTGKGNIDLVNQQMDFTLLTTVKKVSTDNDAKNLFGIAIPIRIKGGLDNPNVRLDTDTLLSASGKKQLGDVKSKVKEQIQKQLNGKAGDFLNNFLNR